MKQFKNQDERLVILTNEEYEIIEKALNNRMVYLGKETDKPNNSLWAFKEWQKCLNLQIEWWNK